MALSIIFMGTPAFSVPTLRTLVDAGHRIVAVYTQPPRPGGRRGLELQKSPVHHAAELLGLPVHTPVNFKDADERQRFIDLRADVAVVVAYGLLLPRAILDGTALGCYNGHASLLPRWRGAAPIQRAIMAGDQKTGMMVMKMDKGLDTGPVALTREVEISETMTAGELHDRLSEVGARAMGEAMVRLEMNDLPLTPQPAEGAVYAAKIDKAETRIDFAKAAIDVHNHIRGLSPAPGAWFEAEIAGKPERIKVLMSEVAKVEAAPGAGENGEPAESRPGKRADGSDGAAVPSPDAEAVPASAIAGMVLSDDLTIACETGAVRLTRLQKAGGKPLSAVDFLRGSPIPAGTRLG